MIKLIFHKILGWKIKGFTKLPNKCVLIAAPHTHWQDFFLGLAIRNSINQNIKFIGKKELFFYPLNILMNFLGGIPVNRNSNTNTVDQISSIFNDRNEFKLAIFPEGSRRKVKKWKTGFYYIAKKSNVPVICISLNFLKKSVTFSKPYYLTSNKEKDFNKLKKNFRDSIGKITKYS